jgi:superoxide reductase
VPVIEKDGDVFRVKVGSVLHPMTRPHYIGWITLKTPYGEFRKFLDVDEEPIAEFPIPSGELPPGPIVAQEWCNLHGLWKSEYKPSE